MISGSVHGLSGIPSVVTPIIMQNIGRKISFIISSILVIIGWTLIYTSKNTVTIILAECIHGLSITSVIIVSSITISEMVDPKYRTMSMSLYGITQTIGISVVSIIGRYIHWKTVSLIMCAPILISLAIGCVWPESPFWLAWKGKYDKSETAFKWLRGNDKEAEKELFALLNLHKENFVENENIKRNRKFMDIWIQISRRDFYIPCLHNFICTYSYFWSGGSVILIYAMDMIRKATRNESAALYGMISIHTISAVGAIFTLFLIKSFKNKTVFLSSTIGDAVCLFAVSLVTYLQSIDLLSKQSLLGLYCLLGAMVASSLGLSTLSLVMPVELMPVKHRGIGGAMLSIFMSVLQASSMKISPYLFRYIGLHGTFLLYSANQLMCTFYIWKYVPETKGRTLTELEYFFNFGKFKRVHSEVIFAIVDNTDN